MDSSPTQQLQFLNLDEIDSASGDRLLRVLSSRSPRLELPWIDSVVVEAEAPPQAADWPQHTHYDCPRTVNDVGGGGEVYQVTMPVATTMQQLYHHHPPPLVPPMGNVTYVTSVAHGYPPVGPPFPPTGMYQPPPQPPAVVRSQRGGKPSPKRVRDGVYPPAPPPPQQTQYPPQFPMHPIQYQYIQGGPPSHMPSPQHATGHPLYIAPMYHHVYNYPPTVYSPIQQPQEEIKIEYEKTENMYTGTVEEKNEVQEPPVVVEEVVEAEPVLKIQPVEAKVVETRIVTPPMNSPPPPPPQVKSNPPINAIKTTAPPSLPPVKRKPEIEETTSPIPQVPNAKPARPSPEAPKSTGTWAGLFKSAPASSHTLPVSPFRPPINAVASIAPPLGTSKTHDPNRSKADPVLKNIGEMLLSYKLDTKPPSLVPRGLTNPSNYCYINATLQALLACPAFYNLIKAISALKKDPTPMAQEKSKTPIIDSMVKFIHEFSTAPPVRPNRRDKSRREPADTSLDMTPSPPFEPTYIYKVLRTMRSEDSFHEEGRQEDAEEFLSLLLNGLNDEMIELKKLATDAGAVVANGDIANGDSHDEDEQWKEVTTKGSRVTRRAELERTPLSDIFRGQLRSSVQRGENQSTDNVQPFFTLQLDIESSQTVNQALEKLVGWDPVDGDSSDVKTFQQQSLDKLPYVLILHLKCFHYRQQTASKIIKSLQYPVDLKIDSKVISGKNKSIKTRNYKLFAVVYHDGNEATKGHYLSDVFHTGSSSWIRYDDGVVKNVKEELVLQPKSPRVPYLLYYRRADKRV